MIILNRNWTLSTGWVKSRSLKATEELQPREDGIGMQRGIEHTQLMDWTKKNHCSSTLGNNIFVENKENNIVANKNTKRRAEFRRKQINC